MIDRLERDRLALLLRRLASGRITNDDYDNERPTRSRDRGLQAVSDAGWTLYSDYHSYRLRGRRALLRHTVDQIGHCVLFLASDLEYEWPPPPPLGALGILVAIVTLGWVDLREPQLWDAWRSAGDHNVWPFYRRADYEEAIRHPRFLVGAPGPAA